MVNTRPVSVTPFLVTVTGAPLSFSDEMALLVRRAVSFERAAAVRLDICLEIPPRPTRATTRMTRDASPSRHSVALASDTAGATGGCDESVATSPQVECPRASVVVHRIRERLGVASSFSFARKAVVRRSNVYVRSWKAPCPL